MEHSFVPITDGILSNSPSNCDLPQTTSVVDNTEDSLTFSNPLDSPCLVPIPYFSENVSRSDSTASPPIGRTNITYSQSHLIPSPIETTHNAGSKPKLDSGFSSWAGTAESQQKFFPVLMTVESEEREPLPDSQVYQPSPVTLVTQPNARPLGSSSVGPDLSALSCANALNEELTDRMLVHNFAEDFREKPNRPFGKASTAYKSKERFKISPDVLRNAAKSESQSLYTTCIDSQPKQPKSSLTYDEHPTFIANRRPDSAPLHNSSHPWSSNGPGFCVMDPGQEGDDENGSLSPGIRHPHRRVRRNTHHASDRTSDSHDVRCKLDSTPRHRCSQRNQAYYPPERQSARPSEFNAGVVLGDENSAPMIPSPRVPSIPDVIPRQLHPTPSIISPRPSVSFIHSPLLQPNLLTRQRSFSFPLTPADEISGVWPLLNGGSQHASSDYAIIEALSTNQRLSLLASRMAQIGDELDDDYRSVPWSFHQLCFTRNTFSVLSLLWSLSSNVISVFTIALDCAYRLIYELVRPDSSSRRFAQSLTPSRQRLWTINHPVTHSTFRHYSPISSPLLPPDPSVRTSTPNERRHSVSFGRSARRRRRPTNERHQGPK